MIITLTGNLLAERTFQFPGWTPGKTQRAAAESFQVGGKGINVAKMLNRIGASTTAWCFAGGESGAECARWLAQSGIPHRIFPSQVPTRSGLVVRSETEEETTFLGPDRCQDAAALENSAAALDGLLNEGNTLALCGSFPGWTSTEAAPLRETVHRWAAAGALVVDSYGPPLEWALERPTKLIKINRHEFDALFPAPEQTRPVPERMSDALRRWPVRSWIVTDGAGPVCYGAVDTPPSMVAPIAVREVSATGSGDVLLAVVLEGLLNRQLSLCEAVILSLPYAAANAAHPGVAEFQLNNLPAPWSVQP